MTAPPAPSNQADVRWWQPAGDWEDCRKLIEHWPGLRREHKETWCELCGAAKAGRSTVVISYLRLRGLLGVGHSSLHRRLQTLQRRGLIRWRIRDGRVQVRFYDPRRVPSTAPPSRAFRVVANAIKQPGLFDDRPELGVTGPNGGVQEGVQQPDPDPVAPAGSATRSRAPVPVPAPPPVPLPKEVSLDGKKRDLQEELLAGAPEYQEGLGIAVQALPPGRVAYGVFAKMENHHLKSPRLTVEWFRRQLGSPRPVTDANGGNLLLVLATARYAMELPAKQIKKSRVGLFASLVIRKNWRHVLPNLPAAKQDLDQLLDAHPGLLSAAWPDEPEKTREGTPAAARGAPQEPSIGADRLEEEYGAELDGLTPEHLEELARRTFGECNAVLTQWRKRRRKQPDNPFDRLLLLRRLASEAGTKMAPAGKADQNGDLPGEAKP